MSILRSSISFHEMLRVSTCFHSFCLLRKNRQLTNPPTTTHPSRITASHPAWPRRRKPTTSSSSSKPTWKILVFLQGAVRLWPSKSACFILESIVQVPSVFLGSVRCWNSYQPTTGIGKRCALRSSWNRGLNCTLLRGSKKTSAGHFLGLPHPFSDSATQQPRGPHPHISRNHLDSPIIDKKV